MDHLTDAEREPRLQRVFAACVQGMIDVLSEPARGKAKKAYCYCNLCGSSALFGGFYITNEEHAVLTPVFLAAQGMEIADADDLQATIVSLLERLRGGFLDYADDVPGELYIDFDIDTGVPHCLLVREKFPQLYDANLHYISWAREFGAVTPDLPPRDRSLSGALKRKLFGKARTEEPVHPTENAEELDLSWFGAVEAGNE